LRALALFFNVLPLATLKAIGTIEIIVNIAKNIAACLRKEKNR
jgi:hypothetical protein